MKSKREFPRSWGKLVLLFIARTALEDETLGAELPGYREYATRTRYRRMPFVW